MRLSKHVTANDINSKTSRSATTTQCDRIGTFGQLFKAFGYIYGQINHITSFAIFCKGFFFPFLWEHCLSKFLDSFIKDFGRLLTQSIWSRWWLRRRKNDNDAKTTNNHKKLSNSRVTKTRAWRLRLEEENHVREVLSSNPCIIYKQCDQIGRFIGLWDDFLKPLATINLPKSLTFLGNYCKGVRIFNFSSEITFGQL